MAAMLNLRHCSIMSSLFFHPKFIHKFLRTSKLTSSYLCGLLRPPSYICVTLQLCHHFFPTQNSIVISYGRPHHVMGVYNLLGVNDLPRQFNDVVTGRSPKLLDWQPAVVGHQLEGPGFESRLYDVIFLPKNSSVVLYVTSSHLRGTPS